MSKARKALKKLQKAADKFEQAIWEMDEAVDLDTVGLDGWVEHNNEVMYDIGADIDAAEEEEEDDD